MTCSVMDHVVSSLPGLFTCHYEKHIKKYVMETPFLLPDGDVLTFFFDPESGRLSDLGETVHRFVAQGISLEANKSWVQKSCLDPEVHFEYGELFIEDLRRPAALAGLINTAIRLADLELAKTQRRPKTFREDVKAYLSTLPITYVSKHRARLRDAQFTFDFYVESPRHAYIETMHAQPKFVQQVGINLLGKWAIAKKNDANMLLITVLHPGLILPTIVSEQLSDLSLMVPWEYRVRLADALAS